MDFAENPDKVVTPQLFSMEFYQDRYSPEKVLRYATTEKLGEGTFGEVRKAVDTVNGSHVAVKSVRVLTRSGGIPKAVFREMESLRQLSECENIVRLLDVYTNETKLCLVTEFVESDLSEVILRTTNYLPRSHIKAYTQMIMRALSHCHEHKIIHRDIKPANLLLTSGGVVKLADFGLARVYDVAHEGGVQSMSHQVATRQYRAPELLFASRRYDFAVDVWSAAVVIAELTTLRTLFPGNNDIDQLFRVFQIMGSPTVENWPGVDQLPDFCKVSFPNMTPIPLSMVIPNGHPDDNAYLSLLLQLDPKKRLTSTAALSHEYLTVSEPRPAMSFELNVPLRATAATGKKLKPVASVEEFVSRVQGMF